MDYSDFHLVQCVSELTENIEIISEAKYYMKNGIKILLSLTHLVLTFN